VTFLVGFITVLCIGNYFRAKRAQERQRQRRLAKLAATNQGGYGNSGGQQQQSGGDNNTISAQTGNYDPPHLPADNGVQA